MESNLLINLAIIIFASKAFGALSKKIKQPPVIGMLLLGIILGPTVFDFIKSGEVISWIAKIGVLLLLFEAGLETDIKRIKDESKQALLPALGGIIFPFIFGYILTFILIGDQTQSLIVGTIFTATSVSISVMSLLDMRKLKSMEGRCIVNSAIIDDIVGILLLTFIFGTLTGSADSGPAISLSILKITIFFTVIIVVGLFVIRPFFLNLKKILLDNVVISLSIAVVLLFSWFAELTGLAAITGAYFAGLFLGQTHHKHSIKKGASDLGKSFFVDVFFVNIGLQFNLFEIEAEPIFLIAFIVFSIVGKLIGSGLGARITGFDLTRSFRISSGMIPRGEVALIVANMALERHLINHDILSATILMVIVSAFITPFLLKYGFVKLGKSTFKK